MSLAKRFQLHGIARLVQANLRRRLLRTLLTVGGVAAAVALFLLVESLSAGLDAALSGGESARTLIVYRQNRYCPQTSFLPQNEAARIAKIDGVESVLPVKVFLSNCRTSLDVVAFHGVPAGELFAARKIELIAGDRAEFERRPDAALVGRAFAARRGLKVGDPFRFNRLEVTVAGIFRSPEPIEESLVVTHLETLQRSAAIQQQGTVTQFEVKVRDPARARAVGEAIDAMLATSTAPTDTRSKLAFLESATAELREILAFGRLFGACCVVVMLVLVGNTVAMAVNERRAELAVLRTLGYRGSRLARLLLSESCVLSIGGGLLGTAAALLTIATTHLTLGVEGVMVTFALSPRLIVEGLLVAAAAGLVAAALPAWKTTRAPIPAALRGA
ncbi:MAG: ABC transporter permease [Planctomycetes bacterium]|nr:ABC transporter permease [Planctomycetota bacterium]